MQLLFFSVHALYLMSVYVYRCDSMSVGSGADFGV